MPNFDIFEAILKSRQLTGDAKKDFLSPDYNKKHDPFLLPDMEKAVERLLIAYDKQEKIVIYGDYDIDGLTATTLLLDSFKSFGFRNVDSYMPNRFIEGYGLTMEAIERIAESGIELIITVDCGSLSEKEIIRAGELNIDVIVTDHHSVAPVQPPAVAVINPKRSDSKYPFIDLPGVAVAFKLVQALQTRLNGLAIGQEKWLLDLVALGTVCDVVTLVDENRMHVYWGLKVLAKTRRPGLKVLMLVAGIENSKIDARSLGFGLGPRMNAAGRLETAQHSLDLLLTDDSMLALDKANQLNQLNITRRLDQDKIFKEAILQADQYLNDPVLVVSNSSWNHGIVGIVAAKLLERYKKPTYVLQEMGEISKGSARSYGDFSAVDAIRSVDDIIIKGGGHRLAAGVTMLTENVNTFRNRVNQFYKSLNLSNQSDLLLPIVDVTIPDLSGLNMNYQNKLKSLEPFGNGNPEPIIKIDNCQVVNIRIMGSDSQHIKISIKDKKGLTIQLLAFNAPEYFFVGLGELITVWFQTTVNDWRGNQSIEGRLIHLNKI